jgi:hypothetical protein
MKWMSRLGEHRRGRRYGFGIGALVAMALVCATALPGTAGATDSGWSIITSPNTGPSETNLLMGSTCTSAWSCFAVGGEFSSLGNNAQPNALIDTWNGSTWSVGPNVTPPGSQASLLWGVACVTSSDCWAVGAQEPSNQQSPVTLAEHWNGSSWSVVPTPADSGYLFSVTCTSTSDCWAVGASLDSQQNPLNGIIYHWNGAQWSETSRASSGQTYDEFESVTCADSSDCWAVGYAGPNQIQYNFLPGVAPTLTGGAALIEHWNGSSWSKVPASGVSAPLGQELTSVTCTDSSNCWAVGSTMDVNGNPSSSLVDRWDGSTWTTTPSLDPSTPANILTAVTCSDASNCWATGATNDASGQNTTPTPYIENWNGTTWTVEPSPNVVAFGWLAGLACVRGTGCFATGFSATSLNNTTTLQTLIEQLQVPAASSQGIHMVGSDGGVFSFGNARFYGSTGGTTLNQPVVGMAATPDGGGYWLVASDGGVFSFGDANFYGSTGGTTLNKPIVGMAATPDGGGYWLVASDGGVFTFGNASFYGSVPGQGIVSRVPIEGIAATPDGEGYWVVGQDGSLYFYGDANYLGSLVGVRLAAPIVGGAAGG